MALLKSFHIGAFRGLRDVHLEELAQINLLVGKNNSGKTSVLEAIQLYSSPFDLYNMAVKSQKREPFSGLKRWEEVKWTFPVKANDEKDDIVLSADRKNVTSHLRMKSEEVVAIDQMDTTRPDMDEVDSFQEESVSVLHIDVEYSVDGHVTDKQKLEIHAQKRILRRTESSLAIFSAEMITPIDHRLYGSTPQMIDAILEDGEKADFLNILQSFDPNITDILIRVPRDNIPVTYVLHKELGNIPISLFGDGLRKVVTLATAVVRSKNGVLLIDELETAVHTDALHDLFLWLVKACKRLNVQLFATTHSLEAVDAILSATDEHLDDLATYRLEVTQTGRKVKRFSGETLQSLRDRLGRDIR